MHPPTSPPAGRPTPEALQFAYEAVGAIWRRRTLAVGFFIGVVTLTVLGLMVAPRTYRSTAKLFVAVGDESVGLDPTATTGQTLSVFESRETELNSVYDVLTSRVIHERVVDVLGPAAILDEGPLPPREGDEVAEGGPATSRFSLPIPSLGGLIKPVTNAIGLSDPYSEREKAVRALDDMITVVRGEKSSVVTVKAEGDSPGLAQRVNEEVVAAFREAHREVNRIAGSKTFFADQAELLKVDFDEAAAALAAARDELGVVTIEGRRSAIETQVVTLEADLLDTTKQLRAVEAEIAALAATLGRLPETEVSESVVGAANSATDDLRKQISTLKVTERQLLAKYTAKHPSVVIVREQLEEAEGRLGDLVAGDVQETSAPSPARRQLEIDLLQKEAVAESLRAREAALVGQLETITAELRDLNTAEPRLMKLAQRREAATAAYREYVVKYEQARVDEARGDRAISNVNVFQPPTYEEKPVAPKKPLVLAAGMAFGLLGAVTLPLLLEFGRLAAPARGDLPDDFPFAERIARDARENAAAENARPAPTRPAPPDVSAEGVTI